MEEKKEAGRGKTVGAVCTASGIIVLLYGIIAAFLMNFNSGIVMVLLSGGALTAAEALYAGWRKYAVFRAVLWAAAAVMIFIFGLSGFIALYGGADNAAGTERAVIVPGAGINGERVSGQLERRLAAAAEYCLKNREAVVVVSGGQGPQESITEALAMERYLVEAGIEKERILKEEDSASTRENMVNSKRILDEYFGGEAYDTVIITSGYHVYRAQRQAERAGLECRHIHAGLAWYEAPVRYIRECAAVVKEFITQS